MWRGCQPADVPNDGAQGGSASLTHRPLQPLGRECWQASAGPSKVDLAEVAREHLIRSNGHIVQDRPLWSVRWADHLGDLPIGHVVGTRADTTGYP
jgi:hypothetical protein